MSTYNATITASADDAQEATNTVTLDDSALNVNATTQTVGLRFQNVTIPQGSTINSATLTVYVTTGSFDDPYITIEGEDTDDAAAFVAENNNITSRTTTTASVTWDATGLGTGLKESPDISTVIQEIVDRAGWASGNDLALILNAIDNTSLLRFRALDGVTESFATLDVDYTAPSSPNPGTSGLLAWWSLDETSGTRADSHSGGYDMSLQGTPGYDTGKVSNAGTVSVTNGAGNYFYYTDSSNNLDCPSGSSMTVCAWVYLTSMPTNHAYPVNRWGNSTTSGRDWSFIIYSTGEVGSVAAMNSGTAQAEAKTAASTITTGTWYFLTFIYDNTVGTYGTVYIAVNAGSTTSAELTTAAKVAGSGLPVSIGDLGHTSTAYGYMAGRVDEVCIYNRVLTSDEISWLYNSGSGRAYADLTAAPSSTQPPRSLHQFRQRNR